MRAAWKLNTLQPGTRRCVFAPDFPTKAKRSRTTHMSKATSRFALPTVLSCARKVASW